jgi:hypothetical protein
VYPVLGSFHNFLSFLQGLALTTGLRRVGIFSEVFAMLFSILVRNLRRP